MTCTGARDGWRSVRHDGLICYRSSGGLRNLRRLLLHCRSCRDRPDLGVRLLFSCRCGAGL